MEDALVVALLRTCRRAAVFGRLGAVGEAVAGFAAFPGDGELVGIFAVFPQHLWEKSPPCINEPVTHLEKIKKRKNKHTVTQVQTYSQVQLALEFSIKESD